MFHSEDSRLVLSSCDPEPIVRSRALGGRIDSLLNSGPGIRRTHLPSWLDGIMSRHSLDSLLISGPGIRFPHGGAVGATLARRIVSTVDSSTDYR